MHAATRTWAVRTVQLVLLLTETSRLRRRRLSTEDPLPLRCAALLNSCENRGEHPGHIRCWSVLKFSFLSSFLRNISKN